ncbi:MAG: hypothetical protein ACR2RD_06690 [Woeseiaceae bacterium]
MSSKPFTVVLFLLSLICVIACSPSDNDADITTVAAVDADAWDSVVLDGARSENGMPRFGELLDEAESQAIRAYVIQQAWRGLNLRAVSANAEKTE